MRVGWGRQSYRVAIVRPIDQISQTSKDTKKQQSSSFDQEGKTPIRSRLGSLLLGTICLLVSAAASFSHINISVDAVRLLT
eukprot:m.95882 g.95882  ORF g.95882 m.95882 type:complete len:81 (+) comp36879_c0_seq4:57-299(+)